MSGNNQDEYQEFAEEYRHVKKGIVQVVITNLLILAILAGLYFLDKQSGFISKVIAKIF